jgi:hypothetical protein
MSGEYVIIKQNEYIRKFKKADAASPATARTLDELRIRKTPIFRRLLEKGVFAEAGEDRYYIDLDQAAEFLALRRKFAFFVGLAIALLALILYLTGNLK